MTTECSTNQKEQSNNLRLTLAVAPDANHQKRFTGNTKKPPSFLPVQALHWLNNLRQSGRTVTGINFCGPGDVLKSWSATAACLHALGEETIPFSLTCLGIGGAELTPELIRHNISRVTLQVDTLRNQTALKLYSWIRPGKKTIPLKEGVKLLLLEQSLAIQTMIAAGLDVCIRTVIHPGINDTEVKEIARAMADLGTSSMEIEGDKEFADTAGKYLASRVVLETEGLLQASEKSMDSGLHTPEPSIHRPNLAVASSDGMDINLHLGQTGQFLIYGPRDDGLTALLETRRAPESDQANRWQALAELLPDCFAVLASHAGDTPRKKLAHSGIDVLLHSGQIEGVVDSLYGGRKKQGCKTTP